MPIMKPVPSYLSLNRHGTYYFRIVVPAPIRALTHGKREIRRSLKTDSQRLALKRARQHAVRFESVFDRVLSMTAKDEYEPSEEDFELFEELLKKPEAGMWADTNDAPASSPEAQLSNSQLEAQQRRREVERLLTGAYHRPLNHEQEPLARQLIELSRPYQPTELRAILPRLRDEIVLRKLSPEHTIRTSDDAPRCDPTIADWTLYEVWQHQLARDRADSSSTGGAG